METKYSKQTFEGYTHRFQVLFRIDEDWRNNIRMDIYSNSGDYEELNKMIEQKKSEKVIGYEIVHRATKEQDELSAKFLDKTLKDL